MKKLWSTLLHEHTSPKSVAAAVWLGVIIGVTPFFGLHLFICIGLSFLFRLNKLITYAAANVSVPPMVPIIGYSSVQLGHRILKGEWYGFDLAMFEYGAQFFTEWLLGCVILGVIGGGILAALVYVLVNDRSPDIVKKAAARYKNAPPKYAWYARMKYRMDPVYTRIAAHIPEHSRVIDLGAGLGMLGVLLAEKHVHTHGMEWDEEKVTVGQQASTQLNVTLERVDITALKKLPEADAVTIVDVLHYFDEDRVGRLLDVATTALRPGGKLLVREGDLDARGGAGWTRWIEKLAVSLGWNQAPAVRFLSREKLRQFMEVRGMRVEIEQASGPTHPGNLLFVGTLNVIDRR